MLYYENPEVRTLFAGPGGIRSRKGGGNAKKGASQEGGEGEEEQRADAHVQRQMDEADDACHLARLAEHVR